MPLIFVKMQLELGDFIFRLNSLNGYRLVFLAPLTFKIQSPYTQGAQPVLQNIVLKKPKNV